MNKKKIILAAGVVLVLAVSRILDFRKEECTGQGRLRD